METSRDWSVEWFESLKWLGIAFLITAVAFVVIAALLLRLTKWGRQFWSVSGNYFRGAGAWRVWLFVAALLFMALLTVRLSVLLSYWGNDMFASFQLAASALKSGDDAALSEAKSGFWDSAKLFTLLITIWTVKELVYLYAKLAFDIRWRVWLTDHVTTDWMAGSAFYRARFIDSTIDNPDQRIQADTITFTEQSRTLALGAVTAIVSVVSFTKVLWDLSGPMTVLGVTIPRAALVIVLAYVLVSTVIAFWIGHPLIRINFLRRAYERQLPLRARPSA